MKLIVTLAIAATVLLSDAHASSALETMIFHATESGKQALDQGEGGGNPFASALVEVLRRPRADLTDLGSELKRLTLQKSGGFQSADAPVSRPRTPWSILPARVGERRRALVLVVSDYSRSGGAQSLPGAKHDAERVAEALKQAGFVTNVALDLSLSEMQARLARFAQESKTQDASIIYTTGHGVRGEQQGLPVAGRLSHR